MIGMAGRNRAVECEIALVKIGPNIFASKKNPQAIEAAKCGTKTRINQKIRCLAEFDFVVLGEQPCEIVVARVEPWPEIAECKPQCWLHTGKAAGGFETKMS